MSAKEWTPAQFDAINARGGSLLVSAAAGSGKTAVLVERIISLITDEKNPIDADRILVVTFTHAAAEEMKDRIAKAIARLIEENPEKSYLRRQQMLLDKAQISTVHSFCMSIVSENFQKLGISPGFSIADASRLDVFKNQAVDEILEEIYENNSEIYLALSEIFGTDKNDRNLIDMILKLDSFISAHPFPDSWLNEKADMYKSAHKAADTVWGKYILQKARAQLSDSIESIRECIYEADMHESVKNAYMSAFESDLENLQEALNAANAENWDELFAIVSAAKKESLKPCRDKITQVLRKNLQTKRSEALSVYESVKSMLVSTEENCLEDMKRTKPFVDALFSCVKMFRERFSQIKRSKNTVDFSDLEHFAINLLVEETSEGYKKTELAKTLSAKFDEIMVDEYQDTNEAQELIFSAVSKNESNLFTVGDVKQSVYSFRQAMPEIFTNRKNAYSPYKRENAAFPASIVLDKNFRSRKNVTETVNFFFDQLMTKETAGIDYKSGEQLAFGAEYYENDDPKTQIAIIDLKEAQEESDVLEARWICEKILAMLREKKQIRDGDTGKMRPIRPGDICILLRSCKNHAHIFAQEMKKYGINAVFESENAFFDKAEIAFMVSLLRIIDNPMQDIPLLSVMMSAVYGFTADEIAQMRIHSPEAKSIYEELLNFSHIKKFSDFIAETKRLRLLSAQMSVSEFITVLYSVTGFADIASAMPQGEARVENLRLLESYAKDYDSFSDETLHGFVKYLNRLEEQKTKFSQSENNSGDLVRIMSIHKSKGLEFPVCILAGCARGFKKESQDALLHMKLGFAVRLRGYSGMHKYSTFVREAISEKLSEDSVSEELRVLYVALTRAKEELIMVCSLKNTEKKLNSLSFAASKSGELRPCSIKKAGSIADWILMCALRHPKADKLRELSNNENIPVFFGAKNKFEISVTSPDASGLIIQEEKINEAEIPADEAFMLELEKKFEFKYPYEELRSIPSKISASGIAESKNSIRSFSRPAFLSEEGATGAEKGTAIHSFMQFCDLKSARTDLESEISRLFEQGFITKVQAQIIDRKKLSAFFEQEISSKMENAEKCFREYRFTSRIDAKEIYSDAISEGGCDIILQGAIDCLIEEDDAVIIIDYKTDRIDNEAELISRYLPQLELYKKAARRIFNKPVKGCFIYSFYMNKTISVT